MPKIGQFAIGNCHLELAGHFGITRKQKEAVAAVTGSLTSRGKFIKSLCVVIKVSVSPEVGYCGSLRIMP